MTDQRDLTVFVIAADYGAHEGWQEPVAAFSTEDAAYAWIGRNMRARHEGQNLKVVPLVLNADPSPDTGAHHG